MTPPRTHQEESTFRNYDAEAAVTYAYARPEYPDKLIDLIIDQHTTSGGGSSLVLDVGCGPGMATRAVAQYFDHAIGLDPGQAMVDTARRLSGSAKSGEAIRYEVCAAEALSTLPALGEFADGGHRECVDLITAATAAHWFDLPRFYGEASKVLKPGGSVIFWATGRHFVDPRTTPNAAKLQALYAEFENGPIRDYELPGNRLCRELYDGLDLPWTYQGGDAALAQLLDEFDEPKFVRLEFNKDGHVDPGEPFLRGGRVPFAMMSRMLGTASPVTRWRVAHQAQLDRGEIEDIVDVLVRRTIEIIREADKDRDWLDTGSDMVVLVIKKKVPAG